MDCPYCSMPYMEYRMDENLGKSKLWDTNMNFWHDCKESPQAKKKIKDDEFVKERKEILLEEKMRKIGKLKTPVFCINCGKAQYPSQPCKHMLEDGFELGVDGGDFYSDSYKATERRKILKKNNLKLKKPNRSTLDSFK